MRSVCASVYSLSPSNNAGIDALLAITRTLSLALTDSTSPSKRPLFKPLGQYTHASTRACAINSAGSVPSISGVVRMSASRRSPSSS